ncbi:hypothetical protein [uncultured Lactobacillus sp.]|uniref:hypothetical protein n=1 Tax=uncultured Lactobacillus sp. TaxID=153152 RepID=UPI002805A0C2|nr:hypothetical protein [uncultured Lactobacillus sp.]
MFKKNELIKLLAAATFAVVGVGAVNTVSHTSTVQASTFHWLRKDHKTVTLGFGDRLPLRIYQNGKHVYYDDDATADGNYTEFAEASIYFT